GRRELIFVNGQEHSTKVILPAVAEEKRIGQMTFAVPLVSPQALDLPTADIRYEEIDYDTREILDPSLSKGEEVITQVGRKGRRELIFVNGQEHSIKVILPAVTEEKRIGQMEREIFLLLNNKNKAVQRELPKTGDDNSNSFKMTGFLLITLLSLFWIKKKQYRKISN
ncbi:G5 domain-containing protein, partial [Streptococcus marimammalium]